MTSAEQAEGTFQEAALACLDGLYGYAMALTRNQTEAEDLVQDTYVRAVAAIEKLAPGSNVKSWLYTIMRNVWLNERRRVSHGPQFIGMDDERQDSVGYSRPSEDPHACYVAKLERENIRAAIAELPLPFREAFILRELEGLSYEEIAAIVNCEKATVMTRFWRAREKLRAALCVSRGRLPLEAKDHGSD